MKKNTALIVLTLPLFIHCSQPKNNDTAIEENSDTASDQMASCIDICTLALTCTEADNLSMVFGADQNACEAGCEGDMSDSMKTCAMAASNCEDIAACSRTTSNDDIGICESLCDLAGGECDLTSDIDQCNIDCSMLLGGFGDLVFGADIQCWESAISDQNCESASQCTPLFY